MNHFQALQTRLAAFASAAFLTVVMLSSIDTLAVTEHHDVRLATASATAGV